MSQAAGWAAIAAAYLLGAVPTGYLLFRALSGEDIRRHGSGNIGATNVLRSGGKAAGIVTLLLDALKGSAAVLLARALAGEPWDAAAAFAAVAGHCYPVFLRFRGGKGIATGCGAYLVLAPVPMAIALAVFLTVAAVTRIVSAGSIAAGVALPLAIAWWQPGRALLISVAAAVVLAIGRHHANIRRLLAGKEHRVDGT